MWAHVSIPYAPHLVAAQSWAENQQFLVNEHRQHLVFEEGITLLLYYFAVELPPFLRIVCPCFRLGSSSLLFYCALNYCVCLTPSNTWHCWYAKWYVWKSCALCEMQISFQEFWDEFFCKVNLYFVATNKSFCICFSIVIKQINIIFTRESNFSLYIKLSVY